MDDNENINVMLTTRILAVARIRISGRWSPPGGGTLIIAAHLTDSKRSDRKNQIGYAECFNVGVLVPCHW